MFLPNAPYLITDFVHLQERPPIPLWYDIALLASCAGTGLLFGYSSLADVQSTITRKFSPFFGWTLAFVADKVAEPIWTSKNGDGNQKAVFFLGTQLFTLFIKDYSVLTT